MSKKKDKQTKPGSTDGAMDISDCESSGSADAKPSVYPGTHWPLDATLELYINYDVVKEIRAVKPDFYPMLYHLTKSDFASVAKVLTKLPAIMEHLQARLDKMKGTPSKPAPSPAPTPVELPKPASPALLKDVKKAKQEILKVLSKVYLNQTDNAQLLNWIKHDIEEKKKGRYMFSMCEQEKEKDEINKKHNTRMQAKTADVKSTPPASVRHPEIQTRLSREEVYANIGLMTTAQIKQVIDEQTRLVYKPGPATSKGPKNKSVGPEPASKSKSVEPASKSKSVEPASKSKSGESASKSKSVESASKSKSGESGKGPKSKSTVTAKEAKSKQKCPSASDKGKGRARPRKASSDSGSDAESSSEAEVTQRKKQRTSKSPSTTSPQKPPPVYKDPGYQFKDILQKVINQRIIDVIPDTSKVQVMPPRASRLPPPRIGPFPMCLYKVEDEEGNSSINNPPWMGTPKIEIDNAEEDEPYDPQILPSQPIVSSGPGVLQKSNPVIRTVCTGLVCGGNDCVHEHTVIVEENGVEMDTVMDTGIQEAKEAEPIIIIDD